VRYVEEERDNYQSLKMINVPVTLKSGKCAVCGREIADRMFTVINTEALCRVTESIRYIKPSVGRIKIKAS